MTRATAVVAIVAAVGIASGPAFGDQGPTVPVGVKIPVVLTETVSSQTAHVGDTFTFKTSKDEKLGDLAVPAGTPGHGRLAAVTPAQGKKHGSLSLQADSIDLPDGHPVWVNIDTTKAPVGRLSKKHSTPVLIPVPFFGGVVQTTSGDMVLDSGIPFSVVTILPRRGPAPLVTDPPTPVPPPVPAGSAAPATPGPGAPAAPGPPATPAAPPATPASATTPTAPASPATPAPHAAGSGIACTAGSRPARPATSRLEAPQL